MNNVWIIHRGAAHDCLTMTQFVIFKFNPMDTLKKKSLLESLLFMSSEPVSVQELKNASDLDEEDIKAVMNELMQDYRERRGGVLISEVAGGFQMHTSPEFFENIRKFKGVAKSQKLSLPALETLAIISYRQPIIKAEVEDLRGVNSDGVIKSLLDKRLIKIAGRKEAPGKPLLYTTTKEFLQYFGLKDLTELPTLKDMERESSV